MLYVKTVVLKLTEEIEGSTIEACQVGPLLENEPIARTRSISVGRTPVVTTKTFSIRELISILVVSQKAKLKRLNFMQKSASCRVLVSLVYFLRGYMIEQAGVFT